MSSIGRLRGLYGITDSKLMPDNDALITRVEAALRGGMTILQYRDKGSDQTKRLQQARLLQNLCNDYQALFIVNDDIALTRACNADGVHLGAGDDSITTARARLGSDAIIGSSCYGSLERALILQTKGANYVAFGACFPSLTKPEAPVAVTPGLLHQASQTLEIPIVAIGGITLDNAPDIISQGVNMVAVISDLFSADSIETQARQYCQFFQAS